MKLPLTLSIALCCMLSACVKQPADPGTSANTKTYIVPGDQRGNPAQTLTVKLYHNVEDYYNDRNVVKTLTIPGDVDSLEVELDSNVTYYYDVYSDDFTITNWALWPYQNKSFKTSAKINKYRISNNPDKIYRPLLLPENRQESKWVAKGSFYREVNTWDTINAEGRNKSIIFMRSQVAVFTDGANKREFRFAVSSNSIAKNAFTIQFYDTENIDFIHPQYHTPYMRCNGPASFQYKALKSNSQNPNLVLPVTDTLYLTSNAFKHTFIMVREK